MGASSSVVQSNFDIAKGNIKCLFDTFLGKDDFCRVNQLHEDLVLKENVRVAFANFVWDRGMQKIEVRDLILRLNEAYMCHVLLQDELDDNRDLNADTILFYLPIFAVSTEYAPLYKHSLDLLRTPPLSRSASFADDSSAMESEIEFQMHSVCLVK